MMVVVVVVLLDEYLEDTDDDACEVSPMKNTKRSLRHLLPLYIGTYILYIVYFMDLCSIHRFGGRTNKDTL